MALMNVNVPDSLVEKIISYKVVNYKDLTMEEKLFNMDGKGWNDVSVDIEANDFLSVFKSEIIDKR